MQNTRDRIFVTSQTNTEIESSMLRPSGAAHVYFFPSKGEIR